MIIQTVQDLIRARASLQVTCRNCTHAAHVKARFLAARYGAGIALEWLKPRFRCSRCQGANVRLGIAVDELAERPPLEFTWFNVYRKYDD